MALPSKMGRRLLAGVLFGMLVYAGILIWADVSSIGDALERIPLWVLPACCGLSFLNYLVRFAKWQRYLKLLDIELSLSTSFLIYLSGLSMSVTPGKMGEVFKSWQIKKVTGVRIHQSAPIVVAERITDLLGYLILVALGGISTMPEYGWVFWLTLALCAVGLFLAGSEGFSRFTSNLMGKLPFLWRLAPRVEGSFASTRVLLAPREILMPTVVSVIGWGLECLGFWLIANAVVPETVPFLYAVFAYAFSAVAGAVLIIFPGGLGVTEYSLGKLLVDKFQVPGQLALEAAQQAAAGVVILARLCTLWFAVIVGFVATGLFTKRYGAIDESSEGAEPGSSG